MYTQVNTTENEDESLIACHLTLEDSVTTWWLHTMPNVKRPVGGSH